jgi:hypothetical protein
MTPEDNARGAELLGRRNDGSATPLELEELSRLQSKALAEMRTRAESPLRAGEEFAPNAPARADVPRPQLDGSDYLEGAQAKDARELGRAAAEVVGDTLSSAVAKFLARIFGR